MNALATMITAQKALEILKAGNERFAAGESTRGDRPAQVRATALAPHPFAAILSCMDSRGPVELIFDTKIGDVFSVRVAGNVVSTDVLGSLEYAVKIAGVTLIVVLGHTRCAAARGAIDGLQLGHLTDLLVKIEPAVAAAGPGSSQDGAYMDRVVEQNVGLGMRRLLDGSPILQALVVSATVQLHGAIYDVETGKVKFLANAEGSA